MQMLNRLKTFFGREKEPEAAAEPPLPFVVYDKVHTIFCLSHISMLTKGEIPDGQLIAPPFVKELNGQFSKKKWASIHSTWWPLFLYNSMHFNVVEFTDELADIVGDFENALLESVNPFIDFAYQCGRDGLELSVAFDTLDAVTQSHLKTSHSHYKAMTEHHTAIIADYFTQNLITPAYRELLR